MHKRKIIGLVSVMSGFLLAGGLILFNTNKDFMTNLFGFYGEKPPATQEELCKFLQDRLADKNLVNPRFIKRYQNDFDRQCKETLKPAAPEKSQLGFFLHNASSGSQTIAGTNNFILYLMSSFWAEKATSTATPETTSKTETQPATDSQTQSAALLDHPKVKAPQPNAEKII